jgi:hypothetical protein
LERALQFAESDVDPLGVQLVEMRWLPYCYLALLMVCLETENQTIYLKDNALGFVYFN